MTSHTPHETRSPDAEPAPAKGTPAWLIGEFRNSLPQRINGLTKALAWATLVANIGIILTGGAVRLTASGLGCPQWPRCTPESWVATQEMGMHGAIEFGNRLLTYVLVIICAAMFFAVVRLNRTHRPLVVLSVLILAGIPAQALIGGVTVLTNLNPWVVSLHFLVSAGLVMLAAMLLLRVKTELRRAAEPVGQHLSEGESDSLSSALAPLILGTAWAAVVLGTIVTGTGPHAGDPGSPRHGFDPDLVTRLHVVPVYMLCAAAVVLVIRHRRLRTSPGRRRAGWWLIAAILAQAAIGYAQHWTGLPIPLVWLHMLGAALLMVSATVVFDLERSLYRTRGISAVPAPPVVSSPH